MNPRIPSICVSVCRNSVQSFAKACESIPATVDLIEFRIDCLDPTEIETNLTALEALIKNISHKTIITYRPADQGGQRPIDRESRLAFWTKHHQSTLIDVEFDLLQSAFENNFLDGSRVICSHHDFDCMPTDAALDFLYQQMAATPARVLKIAVMVDDAVDCLAVFRLLRRARDDGRELIAVGMGAAGIATRVLGPCRGSYLTYASLDDDHSTAPGQLSVGDLTHLYRLDQITPATAVYGVMGRPVSHSLSPRVHNAAFRAAGMDAVYLPFEVSDAAAFLQRMVHPNTREIDWHLRGLSVTAPHKSNVMDHLDWVEPSAREIGAINTILVEGELLRGFNTDASAFLLPLRKRLGELRGLKCAVLGAGGAATAAVWALLNAGAQVTVFGRNDAKAALIADRYGSASSNLAGARFAGFDVVVNTTPVGTAGVDEENSVVTREQLRDARLAYDLVYNPTVTRFLAEAESVGCETLGGIEMFVAQAEAQFELWTGGRAPAGAIDSAIKS